MLRIVWNDSSTFHVLRGLSYIVNKTAMFFTIFYSLFKNHCCPIKMRGMTFVLPPKTVSRMDAGFESPWMGLRRVFGGNTKVMPRCQCIYLKLPFTTDMNQSYLAETCREPVHGGSASASDHHGRWKCRFCRSKTPALRLTVSAR